MSIPVFRIYIPIFTIIFNRSRLILHAEIGTVRKMNENL